jgi:hypothetical protein
MCSSRLHGLSRAKLDIQYRNPITIFLKKSQKITAPGSTGQFLGFF